ncbi:MAG TPA: hypothetical protein VEY95_05490 [Azospirillaceae bacterium]|nr:hypothetical protein [Azospirillaceae bacterium]
MLTGIAAQRSMPVRASPVAASTPQPDPQPAPGVQVDSPNPELTRVAPLVDRLKALKEMGQLATLMGDKRGRRRLAEQAAEVAEGFGGLAGDHVQSMQDYARRYSDNPTTQEYARQTADGNLRLFRQWIGEAETLAHRFDPASAYDEENEVGRGLKRVWKRLDQAQERVRDDTLWAVAPRAGKISLLA